LARHYLEYTMAITEEESFAPLAARMRPRKLQEFFGQTHLLAEDKPLRRAINAGRLHSMIFWGPPGTGKTTLARLIAEQMDAHFIVLSAVLAGVKDIREAVEKAKAIREQQQRGTLLFIDEVHRFNKSQQDAFLPFVEDGTLLFIGATTENPSFAINNALLSRARVYVFKTLAQEEIVQVLQRALQTPDIGLAEKHLQIADELLEQLASYAAGDARRALNLLEILSDLGEKHGDYQLISQDDVQMVLSHSLRMYDKQGDWHYDLISALHKSVRGSDPDAALYWFARMLDGGCDPLYIARRVVRMASEDIGNADPRALELALNAWDVQERLGSPEGELAIAQAVVYLACAAKSNAVYVAFNQVMDDIKAGASLEVPVHLRNAPTKLMKSLGYGKAYRYPHDHPLGYIPDEQYFPDNFALKQYYQPVNRGLEIKIAEKLAYLRSLHDKQK